MSKLPPSLTEPFQVTEAKLLAQLRKAAQREDLIKNDSPFSPFWTLIARLLLKPLSAFAEALQAQVLPSLFVQTATGKALELHADTFRLKRSQATHTKGRVTLTRNTDKGTLLLPIGLRIQSKPIAGKVHELKTTQPARFAEDDKAVTVEVEAVSAGAASALGADQYTVLPDPPPGITVNNPKDWITTSGTDEETDESLRRRITLAVGALGYATLNHYRALIADWAGVDPAHVYAGDPAKDDDGNNILGSRVFHFLKPDGNPSAKECKKYEKKLVDTGLRGDGDIIKIKPLDTVTVDLDITLVLDPHILETERTKIEATVEKMIDAAFRENQAYPQVPRTEPGVNYPFIDLIAAIQAEVPQISVINFDPNQIKPEQHTLPVLGNLKFLKPPKKA